MRLFAHRLALATGRLDVDQVLEELSGRQLIEWMQFYALEPWGEERDDIRAAWILQHLYEWLGGQQRRPLGDFVPPGGMAGETRPRKQTHAEMVAILGLAASFANGAKRGNS